MLRRAKSNYYHSVLNEHKGNSKKAWETVNELIYNKQRSSSPPSELMNSNGEIISNRLAIAEEFNEFLPMWEKRWPHCYLLSVAIIQKTLSFQRTKLVTLFSVTTQPPRSLPFDQPIKRKKKAKRASDIETKFIKYANPVLSYFVSDIFNRCLTEGVYPDSLKVGEYPSSRKETATKQQIIDQFHCCHNLTKFLKSCCILEYTLT